MTGIRHVTVAGDHIITEEHEDGTLTLAPESEAAASMRRHGLRPPTDEELSAFHMSLGPSALDDGDQNMTAEEAIAAGTLDPDAQAQAEREEFEPPVGQPRSITGHLHSPAASWIRESPGHSASASIQAACASSTRPARSSRCAISAVVLG